VKNRKSKISFIKSKLAIVVIIAMTFLAFAPHPTKILMGGDSTMADKVLSKSITDSISGEKIDVPFLERGWGMMLPSFVNEKGIVKNYAKNGRSTRTFIEEGLWTELLNNTEKGDFVILQFGHNDSSVSKGERYTNPAQFRLNFIAFVQEVKAKGATPILCTPVARRKFNNEGLLEPTHGVYPDIIRGVAREQQVPMIDMEKLTSEWLQEEGVENSRRFFHKFAPGESPLYPNGLDDNTHYNELGATYVANLFVKEAKKQKIKGLTKLFIQKKIDMPI
jgi:lysophospholipase L1-like esterase